MIEGPRAARIDELPDVVSLSNGVFSPDGRADMGTMFPLLFSETNIENLRIFVDEGRPIALSGMTIHELSLGDTEVRAACIGSVCTRDDHRGQGLAARLVDDCMAVAADRGASLVLVSGGRGLYRRMGCIDAGLFTVIRVERNSRLPPVSCRVREWTDADVPEMEALYRREPVRFVRAPGEMLRLLRSRSLHARPGRTWVVRVGERTAAYLCVSGPDGKTGPGVLVTREIAGSRHAVLAAAGRIIDASGAECMDIEVPSSDAEMELLAAAFGCARRPTGMHGTLKIIDPSEFSAAPEMAPEDLAALVFGSVEREAPRARSDVLPLPLPCYGLNYI